MGKVQIVGIGPGNFENMTIRADRALAACDVIVGYPVYVDLVKDRYPGKELLATPMTQEARRCRMALELAAAGKTVCLVCSGDSGIYGMAALVYQLRGEAQEPEVEAIPGLTAACSGGALLGAPLTHDFAVVSLSDRLTPWETIEKRLLCAAEADLTIVLYNPASHGRPEHLHRACGILLRVLPEDHRPRGREPPRSDARRTQNGAGRHVLHRLHRQRRRAGDWREFYHTEGIPRCISSVSSAARRRAASWSNF